MKLPDRKQNRLKDFDYSQNGMYFITICTEDRKNILWRNEDSNTVKLSAIGLVTETAVRNIPYHYCNVSVDKYVVMPNHIHMILIISGEDKSNGRIVFAPTVSNIIKHMKEYITKQTGYSIWQKSFHDHIIRNEQDYLEIWNYIDTNPGRWNDDCYFG